MWDVIDQTIKCKNLLLLSVGKCLLLRAKITEFKENYTERGTPVWVSKYLYQVHREKFNLYGNSKPSKFSPRLRHVNTFSKISSIFCGGKLSSSHFFRLGHLALPPKKWFSHGKKFQDKIRCLEYYVLHHFQKMARTKSTHRKKTRKQTKYRLDNTKI